MTDYEATRRRRGERQAVIQNRPRVKRVFFHCSDIAECNYMCMVEIPEGQSVRHKCSKCGKDMIADVR